jgi:hypothetical protein
MGRRALFMTLAALCGVATILIGGLASASGGDEGVSVRFTITHGITTVGDFTAAYQADFSRCASGFPCVVPVNTGGTPPHPGAWDDTASGDVQGTGSYKGSFVLGAAIDLAAQPAPNFAFDSYESYSVTVERCGVGTLILHDQGNLNSTSGLWWIVPGSGTGALAGVSGSGSYSSPAPFTPTKYIGHIRCTKAGDS